MCAVCEVKCADENGLNLCINFHLDTSTSLSFYRSLRRSYSLKKGQLERDYAQVKLTGLSLNKCHMSFIAVGI